MALRNKYVGQVLEDRYAISEKIGEGGMAVVYKALDNRLDRYVALKIMRDETAADEEFRRRFAAESHAVAMLSHPNIVAVYDVSHDDAVEFIVMELVEGITLRQYMDRKGALPWKEVLHFSKQIAKALAHAHSKGIIHRDIKPQNIMLLRDGTIKVGDFGIAALENELGIEQSDEALGSVHYMAPEQARGQLPDARSDIYSLGVVMYEMLTGKKPYTGESLSEILVKHINEKPDLPSDIIPDIPAELEGITLTAMSLDLQKRYQSANELLLDLDMLTQSIIKAETEVDYEYPDVVPIRSVSELPKEKYLRRRKSSSRVTYLLGSFLTIVFALLLVRFVWNFWLYDIFSDAKRLNLPDFTGINYTYLIGSAQYTTLYNFDIKYVVDTEHEAGTVLNQHPDAGRSMMILPEGIDVELTVSTGLTVSELPNVIGFDYREAKLQLENAGFNVVIENNTSDTIAKNCVISMSPNAGEEISVGSTVYLSVSSGASISYVSVPNLIGLSESAAIIRIENAGLVYAGTERRTSDYDIGTVIGQTLAAFTDAEEHTAIYITVSAGPDN